MPFNVASFAAALNHQQAATADAIEAGLTDWAEYVLQQAQQLVPIETGLLSNSGRVAVNGLEAAVGFGSGAAAAYAVYQHENGSLKHDAGRTYKYLETPAVASADKAQQFIGAQIKKVS